MPTSDQNTSTLDRLAALKLLRENMFYADPARYASSDIAEDLPGSARAVAPLIKNVLPSAAIISRDPEERKEQIKKAIQRIRSSGKSNSALGKEILHNVKDMGLGALTPGFILATAVHLLGFRSPRTRSLFGFGKSKWRSPISLGENLKKLVSEKGYAKNLLTNSAHEALTGASMAAGAGIAYPLAARAADPSDRSLEEATQIMQKQPYITSLPASEILSTLPADDSGPITSRLKNTLTGTGLGALTGLAGGFAPTAFKAVGKGIANAISKRPISSGIPEMVRSSLQRDLTNATAVGAGLGGLSGAFTDRYREE
jgi:hypothetical protein